MYGRNFIRVTPISPILVSPTLCYADEQDGDLRPMQFHLFSCSPPFHRIFRPSIFTYVEYKFIYVSLSWPWVLLALILSECIENYSDSPYSEFCHEKCSALSLWKMLTLILELEWFICYLDSVTIMALEFITTNRGGRKLTLNGHIFVLNKKKVILRFFGGVPTTKPVLQLLYVHGRWQSQEGRQRP